MIADKRAATALLSAFRLKEVAYDEDIKVQYSTRYNGRRYSEVPKIQLKGKWLEAIGFSVGDKVHVDYENGKITIRRKK